MSNFNVRLRKALGVRRAGRKGKGGRGRKGRRKGRDGGGEQK